MGSVADILMEPVENFLTLVFISNKESCGFAIFTLQSLSSCQSIVGCSGLNLAQVKETVKPLIFFNNASISLAKLKLKSPSIQTWRVSKSHRNKHKRVVRYAHGQGACNLKAELVKITA